MEKSEREDARVYRTKRDLANALLELLEERDYDDISVRDITFKARISKNTFYNNFNDKDDVLDLLMERYRLMLVEKIKPSLDLLDTKDRRSFFKTIIEEVVHFFKTGGLPFEKILRSNNNHSLLYSVNLFIQKTLLEAKNEYAEFFHGELNSPASAYYYGGAFASLIFFSYKNNYDVTEEKMTEDIMQLISNVI